MAPRRNVHMRFADGISNEKSKNNKHSLCDRNEFNSFNTAAAAAAAHDDDGVYSFSA